MSKQLSKNSRSSSERPLKNVEISREITASRISQNETLSQIDTFQLKCHGKNVAKQFCLSPNCKFKQRWTCFHDDCSCQVEHQNCKMSSISSALKKIKNKISDRSGPLKDEITKVFDSLIQKLTSARDLLIHKIDEEKERLKQIQLSEIEKRFLKVVEKSQKSEFFSATQTKQLWTNLNRQIPKQTNYFEFLKKQIGKYEINVNESLDLLIKSFQSTLKNPQNNHTLSKNHVNLQNPEQIEVFARQGFFNESKVVRIQNDINALIKFFPKQKKIQKTYIIYRASKQNFSMKKFFQISGNITNLVILCETSNGKLIGGYSPLSHGYTNKGRKDFLGNQPAADQSKSSFVFSVSNNEKLDLIKPSFAIYRYRSRACIQFGQGELKLCDFANTVQESCTQVNNGVYEHGNYKAKSKDDYLRFNGGETAEFLAWEWEAWKIEFENVQLLEE